MDSKQHVPDPFPPYPFYNVKQAAVDCVKLFYIYFLFLYLFPTMWRIPSLVLKTQQPNQPGPPSRHYHHVEKKPYKHKAEGRTVLASSTGIFYCEELRCLRRGICHQVAFVLSLVNISYSLLKPNPSILLPH